MSKVTPLRVTVCSMLANVGAAFILPPLLEGNVAPNNAVLDIAKNHRSKLLESSLVVGGLAWVGVMLAQIKP